MFVENVLVAVDFSPPSRLAVTHAAALARRFRAKLTILHVVEPAMALMYAFPAGAESVETERLNEAAKALPALVSAADQEELDLRTIVRCGAMEIEIPAAIRETRADIVVMGTHGRGLLTRAFVGSVTQSLLRHLNVPVLTVCRVSRPPEFKRILFATDLSDSSDEAFRSALDLAALLGASLVVTHVIDKRPEVSYELPEVKARFDEERRLAIEKARSAFAEFESEGKRRGVKTETVLAQGDAADAIVRVADENVVDFIAIAVRKKELLARTFLGATAERLIREAHVPVLSISVGKHVKQDEVLEESSTMQRSMLLL